MQLLTIDIGAGTQDIFLFDSRLDIENGFKLVLPSPTMIVYRRLQQATHQREAILLTGVTMGGGPSAWAAKAHLDAGLKVYATPDAARSFNDDLAAVAAMGVTLVSADEAARLAESVQRIELQDIDFAAITQTFTAYGVSLAHLAAVGVAVFDHGAAPPEISDRQFRFDALAGRLQTARNLGAFAYRAAEIPAAFTRLQAAAQSAGTAGVPVVAMDTAPAAILGATFDPLVRARPWALVANLGNFHTLAFRLGPEGIEGLFEHHTGMLDRPRLEGLLTRLASGALTHAEVFDSQGHGAQILAGDPHPATGSLVVVGPRRSLLHGSFLQPYFAVPFGDMMLAGCFGLLQACADLLPDLREPVQAALNRPGGTGVAPWDA